ncbi:gliding motility-associated C-terminal domain-containing protein [Maribacter sp. X9]|uniref:Ig-like domain-containing protein n=1 Tax=Maribacter sp. X9 TaxID=3402159 RepID=UPI003AF36A5A
MIKNYPSRILSIVLVVILNLGMQSLYGQSIQFAQVIRSEDHVDFSNRSIDGNLLSNATINANSGVALGIGSYSGHLELEFASILPSYQTSYVRIDTEDDLLQFLLGGSLGNLLADVVGAVILGNQEFAIEVKNTNTQVLQADSAIDNDFATDQLRIVTNNVGDYFLAVSPSSSYNRLRITNRVGSLVGLSTQKSLDVFGAFYADGTNSCLAPTYTSFDGLGITLDLLQVAGSGVTNPEFAIDTDKNSFSELGFGVVGVAATLTQTVYFDALSDADDVFYVTIGMDPSLVQLGVLNTIEIAGTNGSSSPGFTNSLSNLLDLDLLGLLNQNGFVEVPIRPGIPVDRLSVDFNSLLGVGLDQRIRIYDVRNAPAEPTIDPGSENLTICAGTTANLIATAENSMTEELLWYDAETGGNLLAVLDSGEVFTTPILNSGTTYYVSAGEKGCVEESPRVAVQVSVVPLPTAADIDIEKQNDGLCNSGELTVIPSSEIAGSFKWYFDDTGSNEINDNSTIDNITYSISTEGKLTVSGLQDDFTDFSVYVKLIEIAASCENALGDLKEVTIAPEDLEFEADIVLETLVSLPEILNLSTTGTINSDEITICAGTSIDLLATIENDLGLEVRWYDALTGGNLLTNLSSGTSFNTGILNETTNFYVSVGSLGCPGESLRATITVTVLDRPTATDIEVLGAENPVCSFSDIVLVPTSAINGTYEWFFDNNATNQIVDGLVLGAVTYSISNTGTLTISGLNEGGSPYSYFVRLERDITGCFNEDGNLKQVSVAVIDSNFSADATLNTVINLDDVLNINSGNTNIILSGSVSGDVNSGDVITLRLNEEEYTGSLDASLNYSIVVDGFDVLLDADNQVELLIDYGSCSFVKQLPLPLPTLPSENTTQVFCALDNPTILDLQLALDDGLLFDALVGGNLLDENTALVDGTVYYTGLLNIPLTVFSRVAITVSLVDVEPPTTTADFQTFCENTDPIIGDIQVDQNNVLFYDSSTGGVALDPNSELENGNYYVSRLENGCESEDRLLINVSIIENDAISLNGQIAEACIGRTYTYTTDSGQANYEWSVTGGSIIDGGSVADDFVSVSWNQLQDASLQVAYVSSNGCSTNNELTVEIETVRCGEVLGSEFCLEVFNEFTPNSDGFNDFFEVACITDYVNNTVTVYNRNGNKVFETQNYQNNWNGIANVGGVLNKGDHLPAGTYYYVINIPELGRNLMGWLQLAR